MISATLGRLIDAVSLSEDEAYQVMGLVMDGQATQAQIGALLAALRAKRETVDELVGFARAMRERSLRVPCSRRPLIDTCGTGGDACDTFNISTTASFVVAAAGVAVAKHGNRAVSSRCGSADVLEATGVRLGLTAEQVGSCIDNVGVGFLYAPNHHPAMRHASAPRRELGIRTVFNVLGPLTNPAGATRQLIGVFDGELCSTMAEVLGRLGSERAMVVHGLGGLDEISLSGPTRISTLQLGRVHTETRLASALGAATAELDAVRGGATVEENAQIMCSVLEGEPGPRREIVCVNAAAGIILGGLTESWAEGVSIAYSAIDSGQARRVLRTLIEYTQKCSGET